MAAIKSAPQRMDSVVIFVVIALTTLRIAAADATITIRGSDTMVILAQKWAERYMNTHPQVEIRVTGGGSGTGLAALQNQTTDLATVSRRIRASESVSCIKVFHQRPHEFQVCLDGLSVYVHEDNTVAELSLADLQQIFTGKATNWSIFGGPNAPITVYGRESSSGTYEFFKKNVLKGLDFSVSAQSMPGTASVVQAVSKDRYGIGYGGAAYGRNARSIRIRRSENDPAFAPTETHVRTRNYPLWRYLYIYADPSQSEGPTKDFLNWILSQEGQAIVSKVGYYPLAPSIPERTEAAEHPIALPTVEGSSKLNRTEKTDMAAGRRPSI